MKYSLFYSFCFILGISIFFNHDSVFCKKKIIKKKKIISKPLGKRIVKSQKNNKQSTTKKQKEPSLGYLVWDATHNTILSSHNLNERFYPASLTKMLTLYLLFKALEKNKITLDTPFIASRLAATQKPSRLGLRLGQNLSVKNCIMALHLRSANDVAIMIGENLGTIYRCFPNESFLENSKTLQSPFRRFPLSLKTIEQKQNLTNFIIHMNDQGKKLNMHRSHFQMPSGWHNSSQYTCLMDMAYLIYALWRDFPQYRHFLSCGSYDIPGYGIKKTTNRLHGRIANLLFGKTGYTAPSGFNLATLLYHKGRYIAVIVMGGQSSAQRFQKTQQLIQKYCQ